MLPQIPGIRRVVLTRRTSDPPFTLSKRAYKRTMNVISPGDDRDYIPIADHGLSVMT